MARVSPYTRTVLLNRSGNSSASAAFAAGGGSEARGFAQEAQQFDQNARTAGNMANEFAAQRKADSKLRAQERFNEMQRQIIPEYENRRLEAQENPNGFADGFDTYYREQAALIEEQVNLSGDENNFDLDHFRQLVDRDRTNRFQKSFDFESGQRVKNTFTGAEQAIDDMNANFVLQSDASYKDFVEHQERIANYAREVGTDIFSPQDTLRLTEFGIDNAAKEFLFKQLQTDPKTARRVIEYGQGGRDALTDFIMMDIEGGAKVVPEPNGGIAKYGINSVANPGVDVRNLTAEGAAEILKTKYWDKRLEEFDPTFQAVAFDALVNHGNDADTWDMIKRSNGNPYSLIEIRKEKYAGLINADPATYAEYGSGWDRRMNEITQYVQTMEAGGQEFLQHAALVDSQILADTKAKIPQALADKEKAQAEQIKIANTVDAFTVKQNEDELAKLIYDDNVPYEQKIVALREADFKNLIGDKFKTEAESLLTGKKNLKKVEYDPNAIADLYARKELMFNKSNKRGKKRVTVSEGMLDDIGDMMVETMKMQQSGEITTSEGRAVIKSLSTDLAAAGKKIGKGNWFADYTHDEKAFRYFADSTERPDLRNQMFLKYTELSAGLDQLESQGIGKDEIERESQKIIQKVVKQSLAEQVPGSASLDELPNQVFTISGDRIFVGAHSKRPKADATVTAAGEIRVIDGVKFRMNPDGKSGVRIE